jgi:hypothetical protein
MSRARNGEGKKGHRWEKEEQLDSSEFFDFSSDSFYLIDATMDAVLSQRSRFVFQSDRQGTSKSPASMNLESLSLKNLKLSKTGFITIFDFYFLSPIPSPA